MTAFAHELAAASPDTKLSVPIHTFLEEAVDVVRAAREYWKPQEAHGVQVLPGLVQVGKQRLTVKYLDDTIEVQKLSQAAHTDYLLTVSPGASKELLAAATDCCEELEVVLAFLFDDGLEDEKDAQLQAIKDSTDSDAISALALDLEEYGALATRHRQALAEIPAFDLEHIANASRFAARLRALPPPNSTSAEAKAKLIARNKTFAALATRVKFIRTAAGFVFHKFPDVVRKFTSTYDRRRRTALRRAQERAPAPPASAATA